MTDNQPSIPGAASNPALAAVAATQDAPAQSFKLQGASSRRDSTPALPTSLVKVKQKADFVPGAARADLPAETTDVEPDDLIELEFQNGERLWLRADEFRKRFGATAARDAAGTVLDVPVSVSLLPTGMQARGPVAWVIKSLKVLGVDLSGMSAEVIGEHVDGRTSEKRPALGLLRCTMNTGGFALAAKPSRKAIVADRNPWLLFIHGTGSSTWSSFGDLWSKDRKLQLRALRDAYGERVLTFEHATLTQSPLQNALELARELPANARLHLVTHSRGGLIGELLCRASVAAGGGNGPAPDLFQPDELDLFKRRSEDQASLELLGQLNEELREKRFNVERFVRVACPALGTTLASGRLDRWLSVFGTIAGTALPGTPLADAFKDLGDFVAAVVKERTRPDRLPGLEAMMPDSNLIKLVNWPAATVTGHLAVIAGDIDPRAWWARLLVWLSDRFYEGDHDLVVNTPSMHGGAKRAGKAVVSFHKSAAVNHFTYFSEKSSAERLVEALTTTKASPDGFEELQKPTTAIARGATQKAAGELPTVFVLPGIMGSELAIAGENVWIQLLALMRGGLGRLAIGVEKVTPTAPVARYYGEIIEKLADTHRVVPFPYDWRLPVEREADRLAEAVQKELKQAKSRNKPVRFLAHSMGGLIVRIMIARHEALWRAVCAQEGTRLVMLGTPNGGSHWISELLVGASPTLRKLARIDIEHNRTQLLEVISRFPGILAMLPVDPRADYFSEAVWRGYFHRARENWVLPAAKDLEAARELRRVLDGSPLDPKHVVYVAGSADVTVAGMEIVRDGERERIEFLATTRGDGRVTWDTGIPPGVPTFYMDVEHGNLAAHKPTFDAIEDLLEDGTTARLPQTPPVTRAATMLFPMPPAEADLFPTDDDLAASVLGAGSRPNRRAAPDRPVEVGVVHGNLAFAKYPVAVGHYAGDTIISAERYLDHTLGGTLSRKHQLGLYPGALETNAIVINSNPQASPPGAVVVGLGTVGGLSAAELARTLTRALLEYVVEWSKIGGRSGTPSDELGVSTLLIGTGAGRMSVSDSVFALLRGVLRANQMLAATGLKERITKLEFIDLWEDRAIQAFQSLQALSSQPVIRDSFVAAPELMTRTGGIRRLSYEEPAGWWHRLQIRGAGEPADPEMCSLRFASTTSRARSEVRTLASQQALLDQFLEQAMASPRDDRAVGRTLFELLLPNALKESAPDEDNLVLKLDEAAARYPWELLEDGRHGEDRPWVVEHGLLRQLESLVFPDTIRDVHENTALVIGDPISSFPILKGAQAEAEAVARMLQSSFDVASYIRPTSDIVATALVARPYKVLHLAGHGVYNYTPPTPRGAQQPSTRKPVTGMVISDGVYLSPELVRQMRPVPELVFINCCHLGFIEDRPELREQRSALAANLATEFIRAGVRAVIAAGWAVADDAAATFATTFYGEMLNRQPFGKAVHTARRATFTDHQGSNTWGAYQCYGDPDYRLMLSAEPVPRSQDTLIISSAHAVQELSNIAAQLKTGRPEDRKQEVERLLRIRDLVKKKNWLHIGLVASGLGRAFAQAGRLDEAIDYYRMALQAEDADASLKDIEQLANLEARKSSGRRTLLRRRTLPSKRSMTQSRSSISSSAVSSPVRRVARPRNACPFSPARTSAAPGSAPPIGESRSST